VAARWRLNQASALSEFSLAVASAARTAEAGFAITWRVEWPFVTAVLQVNS
jgi:hypothetical protein